MKTKFTLCCLFFVLAAGIKNASATTYTWAKSVAGLGLLAQGGDWNTASNWNSSSGHGVPGPGDIAIFNDLLTPVAYSVTLSANVTCTQIISNSLLSVGVTVDNQGHTLTVTGDVAVGANSLLSLGGLLTFIGSGAITINSGIDLGATALVGAGVLNFGNASNTTTNVTIQNATINLNGPNVLSSINLLGGPSAIINYGSLTIINSTANFAVESQFINNASGNVTVTGILSTTTTTTFNLQSDLGGIFNYGTFNAGGALATTINFLMPAGSNGIYNYGTFNAGTTTSACNFNLTGNVSSLITVNLNLVLVGVSINILAGGGPSIYNYGTFNAGSTISPWAFNLSGTKPAIYNNTTTYNSTTYNGAFNLSSISAIYPTSTTALVANNSPGCVFTLLSDANGSATIGQVASGASCTGQFNVQRFMTGGNSLSNRGYRLLSVPVNLTSATSSAAGINYVALNTINSSYTVAGTTYPGAFIAGTGSGFNVYNANPTIYFYKEFLPTSNATYISGKNQGVTSISANQVTLVGGGTYNIPVGNGYLLYFIGSTAGRTTGSASLTPDNAYITNVGYINQQNINVNLWYTPAGGALKLSDASTTTYVGFNMVGNPYPSTLDLKTVYNDNNSATGINPVFYELLDGTNTGYVSYNASTGGTSGYGASEYVASGQGFFVVAKSASSTLTFKETEKPTTVTSPSPIVLALKNTLPARSNSVVAGPLTGLHLKMLRDSNSFSECGIYYNSGWNDNYDDNDALYLSTGSSSVILYSLTADGYPVGINSLGSYANGKTVRVYVKGTADGVYNLQLEDLVNMDTANYHIYLRDNFTRDSVDLVAKKTYAFTITNADTTTYGSGRFTLAVEAKPRPPYQLASFTAQKVAEGVLLTWKTSNEGTHTGFAVQKLDGADPQYNPIYTVQGNGGGIYTYVDHNPVNGNNTYRLAQNEANNTVVYSNPVDIVYNPMSSVGMLSIYPNPAKEIINISCNMASNGSFGTVSQQGYHESIFNSTGLLVMQKEVSGNVWSQDLTSLRPGAYLIEVRADNGSLIGNTKFTKYN